MALDDAVCSHGSDHAQGTQWMPPLWAIKAGKFDMADTDHRYPSYLFSYKPFLPGLHVNPIPDFPSINTGFSPRPFFKKLRMIEQRKKQRKGSCNFYYQFSHKLSVLPWANNFTAMSFIFFHPQNKETEINVPALICYEYFSQVYLILNYRIDIALMYEHHLIVLLFD